MGDDDVTEASEVTVLKTTTGVVELEDSVTAEVVREVEGAIEDVVVGEGEGLVVVVELGLGLGLDEVVVVREGEIEVVVEDDGMKLEVVSMVVDEGVTAVDGSSVEEPVVMFIQAM